MFIPENYCNCVQCFPASIYFTLHQSTKVFPALSSLVILSGISLFFSSCWTFFGGGGSDKVLEMEGMSNNWGTVEQIVVYVGDRILLCYKT